MTGVSQILKSRNWKRIPVSFFTTGEVCVIAKNLLGKILVTFIDNTITAGRIVETEAYNGVNDRAAHSYNGRRTNRTEVMYAKGGIAYVYLCYGIHHLFNIVTGEENVPTAVLVRALEPLYGKEIMLKRLKKSVDNFTVTRGPGNVAKAMGLHTGHSGVPLDKNGIFIVQDSIDRTFQNIIATPRIGVEYAGADALLPYRFILAGSPYVSGSRKQNQSSGVV